MAEDLTGDTSGLELEIDWAPPGFLPEQRESFEKELEHLLNRHSVENECNTPDFVLAAYIRSCLDAFNEAVRARDSWYGIDPQPGWQRTGLLPEQPEQPAEEQP